MEYLVSVVVPVYNAEEYLEKCVESIIMQTYKNLEIILINDGSTDSSYRICNQLACKYENIEVINQENKGVSIARNIGMQNARGDYIFFVDSDDTIPEKAIQKLLEASVDADADMAIGRISDKETIPTGLFTGEEFLKLTLDDNPVAYYACRILYKRLFLQDIEFPEGVSVSEDSFFVFQCALKKPRVVIVNEIVYSYTVNLNSASRTSFTKKKYDDICNLLDRKESVVYEEYNHLMPQFYHLKTKIQMMLLTSLMGVKGKEFRKMEEETLQRFNDVKEYFRPDLPYCNNQYYQILSRNLYYPYKVYYNFRASVVRFIR